MASTPSFHQEYALLARAVRPLSWTVRRSFSGGTPSLHGRYALLGRAAMLVFHRGYAVFRGAETRGQDHSRTTIIRSVFMAGTPFSAAAGEFRVSWKPVVRRRFHRRYAIRGDTRGLCLVAFMRGSPSPDAPRIDSWTDSLPGLTNSIPSSSGSGGVRTLSKSSTILLLRSYSGLHRY
jgi:hypothetical protein